MRERSYEFSSDARGDCSEFGYCAGCGRKRTAAEADSSYCKQCLEAFPSGPISMPILAATDPDQIAALVDDGDGWEWPEAESLIASDVPTVDIRQAAAELLAEVEWIHDDEPH